MKKTLLIVIPILAVLAIAGGWVVMRSDSGSDKDAATREGPVFEFAEPFVVNLADGADAPRFVRAGIALRLSEASAGEYTAGSGTTPAKLTDSAQVRDIVIDALSARTAGDLSSRAGRTEVKKEIVKRVNAKTDLTILDVYYTEFAVQ